MRARKVLAERGGAAVVWVVMTFLYAEVKRGEAYQLTVFTTPARTRAARRQQRRMAQVSSESLRLAVMVSSFWNWCRLAHNSYMGMRQMTFEIPEDMAEEFVKDFPDAEAQSSEVTRLIRCHLSRPTFPTLTDEQWEALNHFDDAADDAWLAEMREKYPMEDTSL